MAVTTNRVNISIEKKLHARLKRLASREETSVSGLIDRFCRAGIDRAEVAADARHDPAVRQVLAELLSPDNLARAARLVGEDQEDPQLFRRRLHALAGHPEPEDATP